MNTGQTLITIGAIALLSIVILRINTGFLSTNSVLQETKTSVFAISYATSTIEKANSLAFDSATDTTSLTNVNQLTDVFSLGPEAGETEDTFDDFDDYNNFVSKENFDMNGYYETRCYVSYIEPTNPDVSVNYRTWHKKIVVEVTSSALISDWNTMEQDTIRLTSIFSYWFFR